MDTGMTKTLADTLYSDHQATAEPVSFATALLQLAQTYTIPKNPWFAGANPADKQDLLRKPQALGRSSPAKKRKGKIPGELVEPGPPIRDDPPSITGDTSWARAIDDSAKSLLKLMAVSGFISAVQYVPDANSVAAQSYTWSAMVTGFFGSTLLQQPKGSLGHFISLLFMISFIPKAAAQSATTDPSKGWRQRAMEALTDAAAHCAFLVPPFVIVLICGVLTAWLLRTNPEGALLSKNAEGALAGLMLLMIPIYRSIRVNVKDGATSNESMRTAVGIGYVLFMFGYCRRIVLRNKKDKGTSFIAVFLGLLIGFSLLAITFIRDFVKDTMELGPAWIIPLVLPLGFLLCDLYFHVTKPDQNPGRQDEEENLRRFVVEQLEAQRRENSNYFSLEGLRRRTGLFNRSGYDLDAEEYSLGGYGDGDASQVPTPPPSVPASRSWFTGLFSKSKAS
jgi:hypothetical protein